MDEPKRKAFQNVSEEDNLEYRRTGLEIYYLLKVKFPRENDQDMDCILNTLCAALYFFASNHVLVENQKQFVHLVYRILDNSLGKHDNAP
jgi:hypothetical protein